MRVCIFPHLREPGCRGDDFVLWLVCTGSLWGPGGPVPMADRDPPIVAILLYLAHRRIRRDELLVKAYDRIR
ncbi:MAG: hypothetical protein R2751_17020 [Bacteroidales bacterium]